MPTDTATERPAKKKKPIAIYYEHPHWFRPLFAELERPDASPADGQRE